MRLTLLTSSAAVVIALATLACSGSDQPAASPTDEVIAPPRNETPAAEESSATTEEPTNEGTDPGSDNSGGSYGLPDGGSGEGGGGGNGSGGGDGGGGGNGGGGGAGSLCQGTSVAESEANNDAASADVVPGQTGSFCGKISAASDVDFVKFTLPANAKSLSMSQSTTSGAIKIEPSVDGQAFSFSGSYPFKPGKEYILKISTSGGALDYRIGITIAQ